MATLDELIVKIALDASGLKQGAKDAVAATGQVSKQLVDTADKGEKAQTGSLAVIVKGWNALALAQRKTAEATVQSGKTMVAATDSVANSTEKVIRSVGALLLIFAGAHSVKSFITDMLNLDAATGRAATNMGQTPEALSGIGRAVERMGGTFSGAVGGLQGLSDAFEQMRTTGNSSIMEPMARLQGLSGRAITFGKDVRQNLYSIADAMHAMKDPVEANFLGRQILGDEGLTNLAMGGSGAFKAAEAKSPKITRQQTEDAQKLQAQLVGVRQGFENIGNAILMDFGPAMLKGITWVKDLIANNRVLIETKVSEWVKDVGTWFSTHKADVDAFGTAVGSLATAAGALATAFASQSPAMQALELFAATMGGRVLGAITSVAGALGAFGKLPLPPALAFLMNPAVLGTAAVGAVLASGDPDKIPLIGKHPDVQPQDSDLGLPGVDDRKSDTSDAQAKAGGAWSWITGAIKKLGFGDRLHDDPKTKENIDDTAKATKGILEVMKAGVTSAFGGTSSVGETTGGAPNLRYGRPNDADGRPSVSGNFRTTPGRHSGGSAGGDHGTAGPPGVDYNAKSAQEQMGISKAEWDAFREGVTDIEGKRYDRMGGGGGKYAGRYQMGPPEVTATARRLGVPRPTNAQFLADPAMQERFFENYTMDHRRSLMLNPKFAAMSPREQLKILGYAHNQGAGGPANSRHGANGAWGYLENGQAGHDGFGTSGAAYPQKIQRRFDQIGRTTPPAGAGTPSPSARAVTDAEVFAARQRLVAGGHDPKDVALRDRYIKEQNTPKAAAPNPPTIDQAAKHVLSALHKARRLTHHEDGKPIMVTPVDKDGSVGGGNPLADLHRWRFDGAMKHASDHAALIAQMTHMAAAGSYSTHHIDRSVTSDTRINGGIHVHTAATDARGIAADIEPHLHRGQAAGRADYGLA